jgi:hypothetical protein
MKTTQSTKQSLKWATLCALNLLARSPGEIKTPSISPSDILLPIVPSDLRSLDVAGFPTPFSGDILRISHSGKVETIASGLTFPTAMTFGPDGKLYVSNFGFPPGG